MNPKAGNGRFVAPMLTVAILQGLLLWWIAHTEDLGAWPGNNRSWHATLLSFGILIAPLIYGLAPWAQRRAAWVFVGLLAVLLLASGWQFGVHASAPDESPWRTGPDTFRLVFIQIIVLFHAVPFLQGYLRCGNWRSAYPVLFLDTWQNALRLALAAVFTGIFLLLLWLCAQLFDMIGLPFIRVLLGSVRGYPALLVCPAFAVGFHLVGSAERLLTALRLQLLALLKWLVPMATLVLVAFSVALLARAPALWAGHRHVLRAVWLLWLVIVTVYLYNAAYQDGSVEAPYPRLLGRILRWSTFLLVMLAGMAAYDLWVRIDAYGLTTSRYWGILVVIVTMAYALGYARAALRPVPWMAGMGPANVCVALGLIAMVSATLTPLAYPEKLVAHSRAQRLVHSDGTAGPADFMSLRFDMGTYGYDELRRLSTDAHAPANIRTGASLALAVTDRQGRARFSFTTVPRIQTTIETYPAGATLDDALRAQILALLPAPEPGMKPGMTIVADPDDVSPPDALELRLRAAARREICSARVPCPVLFVDLDGDGKAEAIAFLNHGATIFQREARGWTTLGNVDWRSDGRAPGERSSSELLQLLRAGDYRVVEPTWKSLQLGGQRLELRLPERARASH
jgi:hypothetical protein